MDVVYLILLILGGVCFLFAALPRAPKGELDLIALGLLFWITVFIIKAVVGLPG